MNLLSVSLETLKSFFHNENMTGFSYISWNHPSALGYTHSTLLRLAKGSIHLHPCCNRLILVVRRALVRSHCLLSKTRHVHDPRYSHEKLSCWIKTHTNEIEKFLSVINSTIE